MLARILLAILLLEAVALACAGVWLHRQGYGVFWAIALPLALALVWRLLIVFTTFVLAGGFRRHNAISSFKAALGESWSTLYLYSIAQPLQGLLTRLDPRASQLDEGPVIVLIHGFVCNAGMWGSLRKELRNTGFARVYSVNLDPFYRSMQRSRADFSEQLTAILQREKVDSAVLIGHSMGGVLARIELAEFPERTALAISIGAPHAGTDMARWVSTLNAGPARPDSTWLLKFNALFTQQNALIAQRLLNIWSNADNIVSPQSHACLQAEESAEQHLVQNAGHLFLAEHRQTRQAVVAFLRARWPVVES